MKLPLILCMAGLFLFSAPAHSLPLSPLEPGQEAPLLEGKPPLGQTSFSYATGVDIYHYENGCKLIDVHGDARYLLYPRQEAPPGEAPQNLRLIPCPARQIYLAATSSMALFHAMDALSCLGFSSIEAGDWYVEEAKQAMERGEILFAGKYNAPDYELLLSGGCELAIESTMILHSPKIQELLEELAIPVLIDRSSYEEHPLGRSEWIKVYGAITGREEEAERFFETQREVVDQLEGIENTGARVAFFSINTGNSVVVRTLSDYVPKMIELAGARYALEDVPGLEGQGKRSTVNMTLEEFYAAAVDADYLVYNASIEAPLNSTQELLEKSELFADFKAFQEGNVWCTDKYLYQATDIVGDLIMDFYHMVTGEGEEAGRFLHHLS